MALTPVKHVAIPVATGAAQAFNVVYGSNYGSSSGASCASTDIRVGAIRWMHDDDILIKFFCTENGADVYLTFEPEADISVRDLMQVMKLLTVLTVSGTTDNSRTMKFIRAHSLERHFRFSQS